MKKDTKLYNVLFPIWFLLIFPVTWIVILPANFLIDSLVLLISIKLLKLTNLKQIYKRMILKVWMIGFASDFAGAGILFLGSSVENPKWNEYLYSLSWNPFDNWYSLAFTAFAVFLSGFLIYIMNLKLSYGNLEIENRKKRIIALSLALFTAPYVFFYPSSLLYGDSLDELKMMTNHIVRRDEFRLEVALDESHFGSREEPIIMYYYSKDIKDAINHADKISDKNTINSKPDYTLFFYNRDYTNRREIPLWVHDDQAYIQYKSTWYALDQEKTESFLSGMEDCLSLRKSSDFNIEPDPTDLRTSEERRDRVDKEGRKASDYPVFEDSRYEYYCEDVELFDTALITFPGEESLDLYTALESGKVTPQELIEHGLKLVAKPRTKAD